MVRGWAWALVVMLASGCVAGTEEAAPPEGAPAPEDKAREALLPPGAAAAETSAPPQGGQGAGEPAGISNNGTAIVIPVAPSEADTTAAPWWFLSTQATPAGGATGYVWTVPQGALQPYAYADDYEVLPFELGTVRGGADGATGYVLSIFHLKAGGAEHLYTRAGVPVEGVSRLTPVLETPISGEPSFDPTLLRLFEPDVKPGDRLGFVLAGFGSGDLGLAFRLLDHDPEYDEEPAEDEAEMLAAFQRLGQGLALAPRGRADATHVNLYEDVNYGLAGVGTFGFEMWAGDVGVDDALPTSALRPAATLRQVTLSSAPEPAEGYGFVTGLSYGTSGAMQYEVAADVYGESLHDDGVAAGAYIPGYYAFTVAADGTGGSATRFHLDAADSDEFQMTALIDYGFSATLETLVGVAAADDHASFSLLPLRGQADPLRLETHAGAVELAIDLPE